MLEFQPESHRKKNASFPPFIYFWSADSRNTVLDELVDNKIGFSRLSLEPEQLRHIELWHRTQFLRMP